MQGKKVASAGKKRKQAALVAYTLSQTSSESSSQKPGSKELDAKIASYFMKMVLLSILWLPQVSIS